MTHSATPGIPLSVRGSLLTCSALGLVAFGVSLLFDVHHAWAALLMAALLLIGLSLAALFFLAVHEVAGAQWHRSITALPLAMAHALPYSAALMLVVLVAYPSLYPWVTHPIHAEGAEAFKAAWLSQPFFLTRSVVYLLVWIVCGQTLVKTMAPNGSGSGTARLRASLLFLILLGPTLVPAAFDWIMSLDPHWYSSILGFYEFASLFLSGIALMIMLGLLARRLYPMQAPDGDQLHDLGKLLFGFATFWAYLWFSQFMLIWYANIPEETTYYLTRLQGGWAMLFWMNPLLNWVIPFVLLIRAKAKRQVPMLAMAAGSAALGRLLDLYLAVMPHIDGARVLPAVVDVLIMAGALALFVLVCIGRIHRGALGADATEKVTARVGAELA